MKITKWVNAFLSVVILVMSIIVLAQIISRYVFSQPLLWTEEVARICLIWITILGAGTVFINDGHIKIELVNFKKKSILYYLQSVVESLCIGSMAVIFIVYGYKMVISEMQTLLPATRLSTGIYIYCVVIFLGLLMLMRMINSVKRVFKNNSQS